MNKCPACGYNMNSYYNISGEIGKLLSQRNKKTVKYLNKIATVITQNIPTDNRENYFKFLFGIQKVDDGIVNWAVERYYQSRYYTTGKGFAYLRTIMLNRNNNMDTLKKNERLLIGSAPPDYKTKEK
jgi:hypothetical protein|tara:strand:+ start:265 stop:645 length:381 start_codon:yes stop_codon:yes gene_type:complete